jgi:hypothetical protein
MVVEIFRPLSIYRHLTHAFVADDMDVTGSSKIN